VHAGTAQGSAQREYTSINDTFLSPKSQLEELFSVACTVLHRRTEVVPGETLNTPRFMIRACLYWTLRGVATCLGTRVDEAACVALAHVHP